MKRSLARARKVRLADVARAARVSVATVSRLMSGKAEVTPETRQRILKAASQLGLNLRERRKSRIIAFLLSNRTVLHPFHSAVLVGAEAYCAEHDYALLFLPYQYPIGSAAKELALPEILQRRETVSGVIVAGTNSPELLERLTARHIAWVVLGNNVVGEGWGDEAAAGAVFFDDIDGAVQVTRYLQALGHRRIGFAGNVRLPWYARRYRGYRQAMAEAGLPPITNDLHAREGEEMGYLATKLMLQQATPPTAIFAGDDAAARGTYLAARDSSLTIPGDLSVAGCNDSWEATALHPALTSVRVFTDELGKQLAELLLRRMEQPEAPVGSLTLPTQLIKRESCGPAPAREEKRAVASRA